MQTSPRKGCDLIKVLFQMRAIPAEAGIYHAEALPGAGELRPSVLKRDLGGVLKHS